MPEKETGRYRCGIRFVCPMCGEAHGFVLWFANPWDEGPPVPGKQLVWQAGETFEDLTVAIQGRPLGSPVEFDGHEPLWLVDGQVWMAPPAPPTRGAA